MSPINDIVAPTSHDRNRRRGKVWLYRSLLEPPAPILRDAGLCQLFIYLLLRASYKHRSTKVWIGQGYKSVDLLPGQCLIGVPKVAAFLGQTESKVRRGIRRLNRLGIVTPHPTPHFTVITLCNWQVYQAAPKRGDDPYGTASGEPSGERSGHKQEDTTLKKESSRGLQRRNSPPHRSWGASDVALPSSLDTPEVRAALSDWLTHKGPKAYKSALGPKPLERVCAKYTSVGPAALIDDINVAIAGSYQGFYFKDKFTRTQANGHQQLASPARIHSGEYSDPARYQSAAAGS